LNINPSLPNPGDTVSATLRSSTIDLDTATITWKINGVKAKSGLGVISASFIAPATGDTNVSVDINSLDGKFTKNFTVSSGSVDILWQGDAYTPPFYKGRTLWSHESTITLLSIPHVGKSPTSLIYRWSLDGEILGNNSGVGKNSLSFTGSILRQPRTVRVDIMTDRDTVVASASLTKPSISPSALVYENNPLYGLMFNREIGDTYLAKTKEFSFVGIPLFFNTLSRTSKEINYSWGSGGDVHTNGEVTYRTQEGASGSSPVALEVTAPASVTQSAEKSFSVQFDE